MDVKEFTISLIVSSLGVAGLFKSLASGYAYGHCSKELSAPENLRMGYRRGWSFIAVAQVADVGEPMKLYGGSRYRHGTKIMDNISWKGQKLALNGRHGYIHTGSDIHKTLKRRLKGTR